MASKPWADTPFALITLPETIPGADTHSSVALAHEMCHVHNLFLRLLNSIYNQAPHIPKDQPEIVKNFLLYIKFWYDGLHHHHSHEEKSVFPRFEKASGLTGVMEENVKQHELFHDGVDELLSYATKTAPENYDGKEVVRIIDGFGHVLREHLNDEIPTLLSLGRFDGKAIKEAWEEALKEVLEIDEYTLLPLLFHAMDVTVHPKNPTPPANTKFFSFPPFPFFVKYLSAFWYERRYNNVWIFAPCNWKGVPQELPFLGQTGSEKQ